MTADRVEVSWDQQEGKWLVLIYGSGSITRCFSEQPQDIDHITLKMEAVDLAENKGFAVSQDRVMIV